MKKNRKKTTAVLIVAIFFAAFAGAVPGDNGKMVLLEKKEPGAVKEAGYSGEASAFVRMLKGADGAAVRIYGDASMDTLLAECCVPGGKLKTGIWLVENRTELRHFPPYDAKFNEWACDGECDSDSDCRYAGLKSRKNGRIQGLIYFYYINLSEGYYNLKLLKDRIKVLDSGKYDYPS